MRSIFLRRIARAGLARRAACAIANFLLAALIGVGGTAAWIYWILTQQA